MVRIIAMLFCLMVAAPVAAAHAQDAPPRLTLDDVVALAVRENRTLRAKQFEYQATRAGEITAGLRPNPTAFYSAEQLGASRNTDAIPQHTVIVGQPIELAGKRGRRLDSARAAIRVSERELADVRRQVIAQVKKAFTDVLVAQATLALAQENLRALDEVERIQRFRAERGDISELELTRIQVQRFAFERDAADARQAIEAAKITLRALAAPEALPAGFDVVGDVDFRDRPFTVRSCTA